MASNDIDTIVAISTPRGTGGISIVRLSGYDIEQFCEHLFSAKLVPKRALFKRFLDSKKMVIDEGIAIYFPSPESFTGECVLELHCHGGHVITDMIVTRCLELGARMARPGEFTERAFLNGKLDLAQAEGISDLINASSKSAARSASLSMQGEFSFQVREIVEDIIEMRKFVEACIDFPAEDIDFLDNRDLKKRLMSCIRKLNLVIKRAHQGRILQEGINVALTGKPNAGKSTLFNLLTGYDSAIVTSTPGTTRDVLREKVLINDVPIFLSDSAGLRESNEEIEKEGIRRAEEEIKAADVVLYIVDCANGSVNQELAHLLPSVLKLCSDGSLFAVVFNKIDMHDFKKSDVSHCLYPFHLISAKEELGINELKNFITDLVGLDEIVEGVFSARKRHLIALGEALKFIEIGKKQLNNTGSGELLAEDLKSAQNNLSSIVGSYSPDDLLGEIFSSFCIGK